MPDDKKTIKIGTSLQLTWAIANGEANLAGYGEIKPVHFLIAILKVVDDSFIKGEIRRLKIPDKVSEKLEKSLDEAGDLLKISSNSAREQRRALRKQIRNQQPGKPPSEIITLHRSAECKIIFQNASERACKSKSASVELTHFIKALFSKYPELQNKIQNQNASVWPGEAESAIADNEKDWQTKKETLIDNIGKNLTELAMAGKLNQVVGRDEEMLQLLRYLRRTSKKNVIIIGEAGVGKTAVVEGLALKLCDKNAPDDLKKLKIFQINIPDLIAGTTYRGDLEKRLKDLLKAAEADRNIIIFFDEIHQLVHASGSSSPIDIANILKPALARDTFQCIGATTTDEFNKYIKNDGALLRRFQILRVEEPSEEDALIIVRERASAISGLQNVEFTEEALKNAIKLSKIYITSRRLPDKAIDLLENAAVYVKINSLAFEKGKLSKDKSIIDSKEIISVLEQEYGVKVSNRSLLNVEYIGQRLSECIIGQNDAIELICKILSQLSVKSVEQPGPIGVLLFTGPSGVGKSFAAEIITEAIFGDKDKHMISLNLNEYKGSHEVSRLIGTPPGFIDHENPGALFRFAGNHPTGVIVLEEIDKAHPDVMDVFMQIFDKGETLDSKGRKTSFKNHLFVLTGNYLPQQKKKAHIGFDVVSEKPQDAASAPNTHLGNLKTEFISRIDRIVKFKMIGKFDYSILIEKLFPELIKSIHNKKPDRIIISDEARDWIIEKLYDEKDGVRGARRRLADIIQSFNLPEIKIANIELNNGNLIIH
jgi:ATP-dependent Clp protease ATP-binding subunit ClpA